MAGLPESREHRDSALKAAVGYQRYLDEPTSAFAAVWTTGERGADGISLSAALGRTADPEASLDELFDRRPIGLPEPQVVDAGPLGGVARCSTIVAFISLTLCAWADSGGVASLSITSIGDPRDRRDEFLTLRAQVQHGSLAATTPPAAHQCAQRWYRAGAGC
nr:hypothetical protein [Micromonospora sp. DSM 115978]